MHHAKVTCSPQRRGNSTVQYGTCTGRRFPGWNPARRSLPTFNKVVDGLCLRLRQIPRPAAQPRTTPVHEVSPTGHPELGHLAEEATSSVSKPVEQHEVHAAAVIGVNGDAVHDP